MIASNILTLLLMESIFEHLKKMYSVLGKINCLRTISAWNAHSNFYYHFYCLQPEKVGQSEVTIRQDRSPWTTLLTSISMDILHAQINAVSIFFTTTMAIISIAAFIGNILVIATVYKTVRLRTSINYYYVNMAASDIIASLTIWPLYLTDEIITDSGSLLRGPLATVGCKFGMFFRLMSTIVSILSLVLIAVDRFVAVVFPLKMALITRKIRATLLIATWLISISYCIIAFLRSSVQEVGQEIFCRFSWNEFASVIYFISGLTLFTVTPLIAIITLYLRIMCALRTRVQPQSSTRFNNLNNNRSRRNRNIMKIFKSIVLAYFITYSFFSFFFYAQNHLPWYFHQRHMQVNFGFYLFCFAIA